jgi:hypothetical protein
MSNWRLAASRHIGFLSELHALGIDLFLYQQGLDTTTPTGKALFQKSIRASAHKAQMCLPSYPRGYWVRTTDFPHCAAACYGWNVILQTNGVILCL